MGIVGLWNIIAATGESKSLQAYYAKKKATLKVDGDRRPIRLGVDMRPCMAECIAAASAPTVNGRWSRSGGEMYILFHKLAGYLRSPVTLVFVFDGPGRPTMKRGTKVIQREPHWTKQAKELIEYFGYYVHQAPGEAEAELAMLNRSGFIDGIITRDSDTFVFGGYVLLRTIPYKKKTFNDEVTLFTSQLLENIGLTKAGLILFALLCGGDYDTGIKGCGASTAHGLVRCGFGEQLLEAVENLQHDELDGFLNEWRISLRNELTNNCKRLLHQRQPHIASLISDSFPSLDILNLYHHPLTSWSPSQNTPEAGLWITKEPDLHNLTRFCYNVFNWDTESVLKSNFSKHIWAGAFLQMVYSQNMFYDHDRKLLATPTMQATVLQSTFKRRKGKYAALMGTERQPRLRVSATNFVKVMSGAFSTEPTDTVDVWPPKDLLPDALQASGFNTVIVPSNRDEGGDLGEGPSKRVSTSDNGGEGNVKKSGAQATTWSGFYDWTGLDDKEMAVGGGDAVGEGPSKRMLELVDGRRGNAKRKKIEVIDLTLD